MSQERDQPRTIIVARRRRPRRCPQFVVRPLDACTGSTAKIAADDSDEPDDGNAADDKDDEDDDDDGGTGSTATIAADDDNAADDEDDDDDGGTGSTATIAYEEAVFSTYLLSARFDSSGILGLSVLSTRLSSKRFIGINASILSFPPGSANIR